ncbi:MAG: HAD family phosphatase [Dysgonomonas sp.]|nr:HAD family phosphatase [Dysgonomonas sp.]
MKSKFCVLFGLDEVLIDTESQYNTIWKHLGDKYGAETGNIEMIVSEKSLHTILTKYFSHLSNEEKQELTKNLKAEEAQFRFHEVKGVGSFIKNLKDNGVKIGLVTNLTQSQLQKVFEETQFDKKMDTIVSVEIIEKFHSKMNPFQLAAKELGYEASECFVFENSLNAIETAHLSGMKVIALAGAHPKGELKNNTVKVINDFSGFTFDKLKELAK